LLNREVVAKIAITDQDVTEFLQLEKAQFTCGAAVSIAQILVTPRKEQQLRNGRTTTQPTKPSPAKGEMLMDRLNSGADFAQLAMDYPKT